MQVQISVVQMAMPSQVQCIKYIVKWYELTGSLAEPVTKHILFKSLCYFAIIVMFAFGAGLGSGLISHLNFTQSGFLPSYFCKFSVYVY